MNSIDEFGRSWRQEAERIRFLHFQRGAGAAEIFARQTLAIYRRAVISRSPPAMDKCFRLRFIGSYCYLKAYLQQGSGRNRPT